MVLRDVLFKGRKTFSEFLDAGEGVSTNILSSRLRALTKDKLLTKSQSVANHKVFEYVPTEKALALIPMMLEMVAWGARFDPRTGAPKEFVERLRCDREGVIKDFRAGFEKPEN